MSVIVNTNSAATTAANNLAASNSLLQRSLNRLSSGSKIVSPADDAGGLAVSMKLSAAARRQSAVATNLGNATSFLQTQDGVLKVAGKVLERIGELKTLAADPTKNSTDLANYNAEFTQLQTELTSLAAEKFNGQALFSATALSIQTTEDGTGSVSLAGIQLLSTAGTPVTVNLTGSPTAFSPSGAGTLTAGAVGIDFFATSNTFLLSGESATYDGAGNWNLPAGYTDITGDSAPLLTSWLGGNGTATFTPSAGTTNTGSVAGAASLSAVSLTTISSALADIATHRANNGAQQSRVGFAAEVLNVNRANLEAANSRITDVDVAAESTQLARYNILVQAGTSMLAQANQSAQAALRLLG